MILESQSIAPALASGLAWSGLDAARKRLVEDIPALTLTFFLSLGMIVAFCPWVVFENALVVPKTWSYWAPALSANVVGTVAAVLFVRAVALSDLGLTIPYLAVTPLITTIGGTAIGEYPNSYELLGIVLIVTGGLNLNPPPENEKKAFLATTLLRRVINNRGSLLMCLVAVLWGITSPLDKLAISASSAPFHAFVSSILVSLLLFLVLLAQGTLNTVGQAFKTKWILLLGVLLAPTAFSLQLVAITHMRVALFEALKRALGVVLSLLWGRVFFGEGFSTRRILAALLMAFGMILVLL